MTGRFAAALACAALVLSACGSGTTRHPTSTAAPTRATVTVVPSVAPTADNATPGASDAVSSAPFAAVAFVDANVGWAERASGEMYGTTDGGQHWEAQYRVQQLNERGPAGISAVSPEVAFALSPTGLLTTTDGGAHWTARALALQPGVDIFGIDFVSRQRGFLIEGRGPATGMRQLIATDDAGVSFHGVMAAESVCFGTPNVGWLADAAGVQRTTDGGKTWTRSFTAPPGLIPQADPNEIACKGPDIAWVVAKGGGGGGLEVYAVFRTEDSGQHWNPVLQGQLYTDLHVTTGAPYAGPVAVVDASTAFVLGSCPNCGSGTSSVRVTHDGGQTWQAYEIPDAGYRSGPMSFIDSVHGWVVSNGAILATTDGGQTWVRQLPP